ncbi:hypothetical protein O7632_05525 [Solwaraspora sp. WMMD406]|uniref:hypothetical protein n=1 Tax=Solwaraspora sp. WMMD406 TaxID=3016095 RepID=UPI0024161314|nr:hypothetical protein [Solwaraspora sp. WMMD406]MDG4763572.1 hypothetical protein [Solwaraspora sp. WMMD406]
MTVAALILSSSPASAKQTSPTPDASGPNSSLLQLNAEGELSATSLSPAGCAGKTHNPHRSSHVPGTINVVGYTKCNYNVAAVKISINLYRSRWYGWELRGSSGLQTNPNSGYIQKNAGSPYCAGDVHDWLGSSYHESVESSGTYYSNTSNQVNGITC